MQKLDFVKNLEIIVENLKSKEIIFHFETGFSLPNENYKYDNIIPLLFSSKSNYERIKSEDGISNILNHYNCNGMYSELNLTDLTRNLVFARADRIITNVN